MSGQVEIFKNLIAIPKRCSSVTSTRRERGAEGTCVRFPLQFPKPVQGLEAQFVAHLQAEFLMCELSLVARVKRRSFRRVALVSFDIATNSWVEYRYDAKDYCRVEKNLGAINGLRGLIELVSRLWFITNLTEMSIHYPKYGQLEAFDVH